MKLVICLDTKIVFYNRNKPQSADIIEMVLEYNRVFIGYPPFKKDIKYDENNLQSCMWNISKDQFEKKDVLDEKFYRSIKINQNIVKEVNPGSFVIIPRPEMGKYFVGEIKKFELVNNPEWKEYYKNLRLSQKKKWHEDKYGSKYHIGDIAQSWEVEEFKKFSPYLFPNWIRHSLFGRSTLGRVKDLQNNSAYDIVKTIYDGGKIDLSTKTVKEKLLYYLTPDSFEHFMCNLLLLEYIPLNQKWIHVGGTGDGGVDCIGVDANSFDVIGIAQCKLKKQSLNQMIKIHQEMKHKFGGVNFVCNFYCTDSIPEGELRYIFNQERILNLFKRHKGSDYWKII